ncbi:MAG: cupin domain-containing protein, partial [Acidimicrobiia bacterium]|nr:cupin domain-containing protein [Acidimicrobiia bacterium]
RATGLTGATLHAVDDTIEVRRAGGAFELFELSGPEGSGPPPHAHPWDEAYIGRTGRVEVTVDSVASIVGPGATAIAPAGALHTYRILDGGASFHVITSGARASLFFADLDANANHGAPTPASLPAIVEIARRHGLWSPLFA